MILCYSKQMNTDDSFRIHYPKKLACEGMVKLAVMCYREDVL